MVNGTTNGAINPFVARCIHEILGVEGELVEQYDYAALDPDDRIQIRLDKNNAPQEVVNLYAHQMGSSIFPPIVVTLDHRTVDGNTRRNARRQRGDRYAPAIVLPISLDDDPSKRPLLELLGYKLNNINGKPLDKIERMKMAELMIKTGMNDQDIAGEVGVTPGEVGKRRKYISAKQRLHEVDFDDDADLKPKHLAKLGETMITALDDDSYRDLAHLAKDADMSVADIDTLATKLRKMESADLRHEALANERESRAEHIANRRHGIQVNPPYARQLRETIGRLLAKAEDDAFVEKNAEYEEAHLEFLDATIVRLQAIRQLQDERLGDIRPRPTHDAEQRLPA
jgi:hypothetical protein